MVVGIIAANQLRYSPYVFYYANILKELQIDYEILVPKRNKLVNDIKVECVHEFVWEDRVPSVINYIKYCYNVKKYAIKKFDFMIVLTTNVAVFSNNWLKKYFDKRYIVDIRDYTYENNKIFYMFEKRAIANAATRVISSNKFQVFLPKNEYLVCHNNNWPEQRNRDIVSNKKNSNRIVIGYVGAIAYKNQCKKMMDLIQNDSRFEFHIYGDGVVKKDLMDYAQKLQCDRVQFFGRYNPEEKKNIIENIDILFNAYGNNSPLVNYALSNKLYDALYFCKPILNSPDTYMSEMCGILSYEIDFTKESDLNALLEWYKGLDNKVIEEYSNKQYLSIIKEDIMTKNRIKNILIKMKEKSL